MAVTLMCPNLRCRKILMVPTDARGTRVRCSYCGTVLFVPWAKPFKKGKSMSEMATVAVEEGSETDGKKKKKKK